MNLPIPFAALDDRLAFVGTSGSGKTYAAGVLVEALLHKKRRTIIIDPLGVWYGLRADPDGKASSAFNAVIFGGPHGDLPITPLAGALIGGAVAGSADSCIVDLSQLGTKAAERRFMLAFLEALYRGSKGEPVHLVIDEADMWAPQKLIDKEGEAAKLLGMMETVVRRGRVRGFIPWLITQRPAVLSKDVLSQADGLAIFKLTSSQDRDAIGAWVEGQADKGQWKEIYGALAGKERGHAVIWLPGHGVLTADVAFPPKTTFDSSATPKRGEKRRTADLKPLDVGALKERLATVEAEVTANDPAALKKRIATLEAEARKVATTTQATKTVERVVEKVVADPRAIAQAEKRALWVGTTTGAVEAYEEALRLVDKLPVVQAIAKITQTKDRAKETRGKAIEANQAERAVSTVPPNPVPAGRPTPTPRAAPVMLPPIDGALPVAAAKAITAMAELRSLGVLEPKREIIAAMANYSNIQSRPIREAFSLLVDTGLAVAPSAGRLTLTDAGLAAAPATPAPVSAEEMRARISAAIGGAASKVLDYLADFYPSSQSRDEIAAACGYSNIQSRPIREAFSKLLDMGFVTSPQSNHLVASEVLFP